MQTLRVWVCYAMPTRVWLREVLLPNPATIAQALAASGFERDFPALDPWNQGVGVYGKPRPADFLLADGDRVEIYRSLTFDPKESRRRRAEHRRAQRTRGGRVRPAGLL